MTPQERQLVADLFDRLAALENAPRDPDAERTIAQGLQRAPNAVYALVQTTLLQDEALKRADARIRELEGSGPQDAPQDRGFLDNMREQLFGGERRGSVPPVPERAKWNSGQVAGTAPPPLPMSSPAQAGYGGGGQPGYGAPAGAGGSFLGTAAATAAGVIGGGLMFNAIRNLMGGQQGSAFASPANEASDRQSPWSGDARDSDLARDAGVNDIGRGGEDRGAQRAGLFGNDDTTSNDSSADDSNDDDFDFADSGDVDIDDA